MFSLVISLISIALIAALALATLYYGGTAFERGAATAGAAKLFSQAQHLQAASELYRADTGGYPLSMGDLVNGNYLKSMPVAALTPGHQASPSLMSYAQAQAAVTWKMVLNGSPVFAITPVSREICEAVNLKSFGVSGILKSARASSILQCYGTSLSNLTVLTASSGEALIAASVSTQANLSLGTVLTTAPPAVTSGDTTVAGWLTVPGGGGVSPPVEPPALDAGRGTGVLSAVYQGKVVTQAVGLELGGVLALRNSGSATVTVTLVNDSAKDLVLSGTGGETLVNASDCQILAAGATCSVSWPFGNNHSYSTSWGVGVSFNDGPDLVQVTFPFSFSEASISVDSSPPVYDAPIGTVVASTITMTSNLKEPFNYALLAHPLSRVLSDSCAGRMLYLQPCVLSTEHTVFFPSYDREIQGPANWTIGQGTILLTQLGAADPYITNLSTNSVSSTFLSVEPTGSSVVLGDAVMAKGSAVQAEFLIKNRSPAYSAAVSQIQAFSAPGLTISHNCGVLSPLGSCLVSVTGTVAVLDAWYGSGVQITGEMSPVGASVPAPSPNYDPTTFYFGLNAYTDARYTALYPFRTL